MPFRVSDATIFAHAVRSTRLNRFALSEIQAQLSSGKRINSLGDDPADAARVLRLRRLDARLDQFDRNIDAARRRLEPSESSLAGLSDVLVRLRELAISIDTESAEQRSKVQTEVEEIFQEVLRVSNARFADGYLFAGFRTDTAAFSQTGAFTPGVVDPVNPTGTYNGDTNTLRIQIGEATQIDASVPGSAIFEGDFDGDGATDAGRVNLFDVIRDFRNRLLDPAVAGAPVDVIDELDTAAAQVLEVRGRIGASLGRLETTEGQLESLKISLEMERSALEDLDLVEASTELASRENIYQASLAVTARVIQPSLLDFLG